MLTYAAEFVKNQMLLRRIHSDVLQLPVDQLPRVDVEP
jgi:hypothetical protein